MLPRRARILIDRMPAHGVTAAAWFALAACLPIRQLHAQARATRAGDARGRSTSPGASRPKKSSSATDLTPDSSCSSGPASRRAPWSSIRRSGFSTWFRATTVRCATASVSGAKASNGPVWCGQPQGRVARLASAAGDDLAPALPPALHGRRSRKSDGRPRALSRIDGLSHSRHQPAGDDRACHLVGLLPAGQWRHHRSLRAGAGRHEGGGPARRQSLTSDSKVDCMGPHMRTRAYRPRDCDASRHGDWRSC